ncbi:MAG: sulfotransferase family 2 domain-containing protein [Pseudoruegeria sp.]
MSTFNKFNRLGPARFAQLMKRSGKIWVFHHIPKTAGSTLTKELRFCLPPYRNISFEEWDSGVDRHKGLMNAVESFLEDNEEVGYRSCSGHLRPQHLERLRAGLPRAQVFTFLRDPIERFISEYRYARTSRYPAHKEFAVRYPDIDAYIEDDVSHNKLWKFIVPSATEATPKNIRAIFDRYAFIGLVEEFGPHFSYFSGLSGYPKVPSVRTNTTNNTVDNMIADTADLRARIAKVNQKDVALYTAVRRVLDPAREDMAAYCKAQHDYFTGVAKGT